MKDTSTTVTTIKINTKLLDEFKVEQTKNKTNLQQVVERAIYLYAKDEGFRKQIKSTTQYEVIKKIGY